MKNIIRFGPAGSSISFFEQGHKSSLQMPEWLNKLGLNAFEYQCSRGVKISDESAKRLGELALHYNIKLSIHSPYYINTATPDNEKYERSILYVMKTLYTAKIMRAKRVVVHMGSCKGMSRTEALNRTKDFIMDILSRADEAGFGDIHLCMETMGKVNQLGTLEEVLTVCVLDERLLPAIDFGHLYARDFGALQREKDYKKILDMIENVLGFERLKNLHCHFSKIQYSEKGGEIRHINFEDKLYGPPFEPLANQIAKRHLTPVLICESAGKQAEDALYMKKTYEKILEKLS